MKNNNNPLQQPRNIYIDRAWFKHQSSNLQRVSSLVCSYRKFKLIVVYFSEDLFIPFCLITCCLLSIVIYANFSFVSEASTQKEDDEQPVFLPSTTSPHISTSCFIQTPQLQFPIGTVLTSLVLLLILSFFFVHCSKIDLFMPFLIQ